MSRIRTVILTGGITLAVLLGGYGLRSFITWVRATPPTPTTSPTAALAVTPAPPLVPSPTPSLLRPATAYTDSDQDGLPDALEAIYRTDSANRDTDGDGHLDGSEVANGYDPTIQSPNDKITIPTPSPTGPTFTQQYFDRVGLPPSRENLAASGELDEFIAIVNARGFLPAVRDDELHVVGAAGRAAVSTYLDTVSPKHNAQLVKVSPTDVDRAFRTLIERADPATLDGLSATLTTNADLLRGAPVPGEALALHKQYLAATLSLKENVEMLKNYQTDFVGVLVAASRIDNLSGVFRAVEEGIRELERQYGLT